MFASLGGSAPARAGPVGPTLSLEDWLAFDSISVARETFVLLIRTGGGGGGEA